MTEIPPYEKGMTFQGYVEKHADGEIAASWSVRDVSGPGGRTWYTNSYAMESLQEAEARLQDIARQFGFPEEAVKIHRKGFGEQA